MTAQRISDGLDFFIRNERAVDTNDLTSSRRERHVALAEQLLRALLIQYCAAIDLRRHLERNARWEVGFDRACDDIHRWALRRHDQMNAGCARHLRETLHDNFDILASDAHQVGEFVDDDDDVRQRLEVHLLFFGYKQPERSNPVCTVRDNISPRFFALRTRLLNISMLRTDSDAMRL